ncbi:hypothetical protein ABHI18_010168, partial [Aspergillus niger]
AKSRTVSAQRPGGAISNGILPSCVRAYLSGPALNNSPTVSHDSRPINQSVQNRVAQMVLAVDIRPVRNEQRARFPRLISSYISGQHGAEVLAPGYPAGSQRSSRVEYQCN